MNELESRYHSILNRIQSIQPQSPDLTVIAVTKNRTIEQIHALYRLGHRDFGENYAQEFISKAQALKELGCTNISWHFIGHLQTNKVKQILPYVSCIHTVDSVSLANELSKRWTAINPSVPLKVFLQVNIDYESTKSGLSPDAVVQLKNEFTRFTSLAFQGLMCIPAKDNPRLAFQNLRSLELQLRPLTQGNLSMGMSQDFETAIQEGATHIRIGSAFFV